METDDVGQKAIRDPKEFVRSINKRSKFKQCISEVVKDVMIDINGEMDEYGEDFDYRGKIRDEAWVKDLSKKVVGNYQKMVQRGRIDSFGVAWNKLNM